VVSTTVQYPSKLEVLTASFKEIVEYVSCSGLPRCRKTLSQFNPFVVACLYQWLIIYWPSRLSGICSNVASSPTRERLVRYKLSNWCVLDFFLIEAARGSMGLTPRYDQLQFYVAHVPDWTAMDLHRGVG
jgi:hypothetical protein